MRKVSNRLVPYVASANHHPKQDVVDYQHHSNAGAITTHQTTTNKCLAIFFGPCHPRRRRRFYLLRRGRRNHSTDIREETTSERSSSCDGEDHEDCRDCSSNSNDNNNNSQQLAIWDSMLEHDFPTSTPAERERFLRGRTYEKAKKKMNNYMEWRYDNHLDEYRNLLPDTSDTEHWTYAIAKALQVCPDVEVKSSNIPRIVRFGDGEDLRCINGKRIVQVIPALMDTKLAPQSFYAVIVAIYLDMKLDRHSCEDIMVFIDVRSGKGWPNPPAPSLVPFVKEITKAFADAFPERLSCCLVYPVPSPARVLWALFQRFLHPKHTQKIRICWGMALTNSPPPVKILREYCDEETIEMIENNRRLEFR